MCTRAHISRNDVLVPRTGGPAGHVVTGRWDGPQATFDADPQGSAAADVWRIAAGIRRRRKALGLTQADVALRAGVALRSVHELETGTAWPSTRTVGSIASVLGAGLGVFQRKAQP